MDEDADIYDPHSDLSGQYDAVRDALAYLMRDNKATESQVQEASGEGYSEIPNTHVGTGFDTEDDDPVSALQVTRLGNTLRYWSNPGTVRLISIPLLLMARFRRGVSQRYLPAEKGRSYPAHIYVTVGHTTIHRQVTTRTYDYPDSSIYIARIHI